MIIEYENVGSLRMTTATATTAPENNDVIGGMRKNNRAERAARTLEHFIDVVCEISKKKVIMTTSFWNLSFPVFTWTSPFAVCSVNNKRCKE